MHLRTAILNGRINILPETEQEIRVLTTAQLGNQKIASGGMLLTCNLSQGTKHGSPICLVMPAFLFDPFCPCQSNGLMTLILKEIKMSSATACQGQTSCNVKKPRCKGEDEGGSPACAFWRAACYTSAKKEHTIWGHFFGHCHSFKQYGSQTWNLMSEHCHCSAVWFDRIKQK